MKVLIVSKTKLGNGACVGGIIKGSHESARLLPRGSYNNAQDAYNIGEIWDLTLVKCKNLRPPHTEDYTVVGKEKAGRILDLPGFIREKLNPYGGELDDLYDGKLSFSSSNKGYICEAVGVPTYSTLFWIADRDMPLVNAWDKPHYQWASFPQSCLIPYKGFPEPIPVIKKGTIVRISLARWFPEAAERAEQKCWLQLSGWY